MSSARAVVDVVVPVYRDLAATRRCLESVLAHPQATPFELVLIDDASPEPALSAYLDEVATRPGVHLLRNAANAGFVVSVNRGMALHPERDVVLLNSDTEVANDWLDRLRACAWRGDDIGTVTPFSNNATICSYPLFCADNPAPAEGVAGLDAMFARVNAGAALDIPTAVGFCMYIRRACLDRVGAFDAERFGRGYGEENDFSRRAAKAGWRNLLCADVFVFHAGGVSFRDERAALTRNAGTVLDGLHPEYHALVRDFIAADAPARYRHAVDVERARARLAAAAPAPKPTRPVLLHVLHDLGGGIDRWFDDVRRADRQAVHLALRPYCHGRRFGEGLLLSLADADGERPLALHRFVEPIEACVGTHPEYRRALTDIVRAHGVDAVLVSSLIGHALDALDTGLPTLVVGHDYFPLCPAINLHFGEVCASCDSDRLRACAGANPGFNLPFIDFPAETRLALRARYLALLATRPLALVAPDVSVRRHLAGLFPDLAAIPAVTIEHGVVDRFAPLPAARGQGGDEQAVGMGGHRLRVLVLGMLAVSKGVDLLRAGLDRLLEFADLYLVGAREVGELFLDRPGVRVIESYRLDELPGLLADIRPDVGLLLSIWPETYSYTLTELRMLGIPPAATRLGAFAERIRPGETGFLFEPDADAMLACLRALDADRAGLRAVADRLRAETARAATDMVADYRRLLPSGFGDQAPDWLDRSPSAAERETLAWAHATVTQWKTIKRQHLLLDLRAARVGEWRARVDGLTAELATALAEAARARESALAELARERDGLVAALAAHADECADARARVEALHDELAAARAALVETRASTSWRVTRPLRWLGGWVRRLSGR